MSAKRQDTQRLKAWRDALYTQLYTFVAPAAFEGFETLDRLTPEQALNTPMHPYPAGTAWGPCWTYGWFRTRLTLPPVVYCRGFQCGQLYHGTQSLLLQSGCGRQAAAVH